MGWNSEIVGENCQCQAGYVPATGTDAACTHGGSGFDGACNCECDCLAETTSEGCHAICTLAVADGGWGYDSCSTSGGCTCNAVTSFIDQ